MNVLDSEQLHYVHSVLAEDNWVYGETTDSSRGLKIPFWGMELSYDIVFNEYILKRIQAFSNMKFSLLRVYANGQTHGQDGDFHIDSNNEKSYTFILYATDLSSEHKLDSIEYAQLQGYTEFLLPDGTIYGVPPVYNSGILFPSHLMHRGTSFNRLVKSLRVTIAWKLIHVA